MRYDTKTMLERMISEIDAPRAARTRVRVRLERAFEGDDVNDLVQSQDSGGLPLRRSALGRSLALAAVVISIAGVGLAIALTRAEPRPSVLVGPAGTTGSPAACSAHGLKMTVGDYAVAMNSYQQEVFIQNTSNTACTLWAFPTISELQVGSTPIAAEDSYLTELDGQAPTAVSLAAGEEAAFSIYGSSFDAVQNRRCLIAKSLTVQLADTGYQRLELSVPACASPHDSVALSVTPIVTGHPSLDYFSRFSQVSSHK
jgi:hypothetical protein